MLQGTEHRVQFVFLLLSSSQNLRSANVMYLSNEKAVLCVQIVKCEGKQYEQKKEGFGRAEREPLQSLSQLFFSPAHVNQHINITIRGTQRRFPPKYIKNTFKAIQRTFRSLEKHSKRCCKICTCSVILGDFESFRNYKGLIIIFPKILDEI